MRRLFFLIVSAAIFTACQKSLGFSVDNGTIEPPRGGDSTGDTNPDSIIVAGDIITYEVITDDSGGWFGIWNDSTGNLVSNKLDNVSYGSPNYYTSGWRYSYVCPNKPFQALISVDAFSFDKDITVNLYKNGKLLKVSTNEPKKGFAKLLLTAQTDSLQHPANIPVLKYEVTVSDADTTQFMADSWLGEWHTGDGKVNSFYDPLLSGTLGMPSGWSYTFLPEKLPFTMQMGSWPYTPGGGSVTMNLYVDGKLVKTSTSREPVYSNDFTYTVN